MKGIRRLCTFTLISLFSLAGVAAQAGGQNTVLNLLSDASKLLGKNGRKARGGSAER